MSSVEQPPVTVTSPTRPPAARPKTVHRRDIDGLRGFAIALVVLFHIFVGRVSSGVDVFLFVGGIFFFGPQIRNALNPGGITIVQSIVRLLRRLFPAMAVAIALTFALAWGVYSAGRLEGVGQDAIASLMYQQNNNLAHRGMEYAAISNDVSLYQHLWSMSAQMQIYVSSLLVIATLAFLLGRVFKLQRADRILMWLVALATLASFVYAIYLHRTAQDLNYYSAFSRFWEIGLGGLAGFWIRKRPTTTAPLRLPAPLLVIVGLSLIVATGLFLDGSNQFPGPLTLIPLFGAFTVVMAGGNRFLESAPLQFLGRISYSFYLWHWPLLVLATYWVSRNLSDLIDTAALTSAAEASNPVAAFFSGGITGTLGGGVGTVVGLLVLATSMLIAWAGYRWVETPLREDARPVRSWLPFTLPARTTTSHTTNSATTTTANGAGRGGRVKGGIIALTVVTCVFAPMATVLSAHSAIDRVRNITPVETVDRKFYPGPDELLAGRHVPPADVLPNPSMPTEAMYPASSNDGCVAHFPHRELILTQRGNETDIPCVYGDRDSERTLVVAGSSHAEHLLPAWDEVGKRQGIAIIPMIKLGCTYGGPSVRSNGEDYPECVIWQDLVTQWILDNPPTEGVAVTTTHEGFGTRGPDFVPDEMRATLAPLSRAGIRVISMRDTPWPHQGGEPIDVRLCVDDGRYRPGDPNRDCGMAREEAYSPKNPAIKALAGLNVSHVDMSDALCNETRCPGVIGNVLVYRDSSHLTNLYARLLSDHLEELVFPADSKTDSKANSKAESKSKSKSMTTTPTTTQRGSAS